LKEPISSRYSQKNSFSFSIGKYNIIKKLNTSNTANTIQKIINRKAIILVNQEKSGFVGDTLSVFSISIGKSIFCIFLKYLNFTNYNNKLKKRKL
jgi:hypothetical protein